MPSSIDFSHERQFIDAGALHIAGVDEAGRGPLAGPVVTAAVILDPQNIPDGINDSKKLKPARREELCAGIFATAQVSICVAPPSVIEEKNIRGATLWAMTQAVLGLGQQPDHVLIDGRDVPPGLPCPGSYLIGGDGLSLSIAAASIIAKTVRDSMCPIMDVDSPGYDFAKHKGYGTAQHMKALNAHGPCPHHRAAFGPVAQLSLFAQGKPERH